jgi:Protein of unknown function (DUF3768)
MNVHGAMFAACRRTKAKMLMGETMTNVATLKTSTRIRVLNDNFRSTFLGGKIVMSAGVADLPMGVRAQVVVKVQNFVDFNEDNDPYGEHDFGSFEVAGETFFWKIDYHNKQMTGESEDPSDPEQTARVLTIMFAGEY